MSAFSLFSSTFASTSKPVQNQVNNKANSTNSINTISQQQNRSTIQTNNMVPSTSPISRGRKTLSKDSTISNNSSNQTAISRNSSKTTSRNNLKTESFEKYSSNTEDVWDATDILDANNLDLNESNLKYLTLNSENFSTSEPNIINTQPTSLSNKTNSFRLNNQTSTDHLLAVQAAAKLVIEQASKNLSFSKENESDFVFNTEKNVSKTDTLSKSSLTGHNSSELQNSPSYLLLKMKKQRTQSDNEATSPPQKLQQHSISLSGHSGSSLVEKPTKNTPSNSDSVNIEKQSDPSNSSNISQTTSLNIQQQNELNYINSKNVKNYSGKSSKEKTRITKFKNLLKIQNLEIATLRKTAWSGIPNEYRGDVWRLLCGYMPCSIERRKSALNRKRNEYNSLIKRYYESSNDPEHATTFRQIHIDIPRTHPGIELFQKSQIQNMLQRILFIWAIRHPASGYVQGINDLATPFMVNFIIDYLYNGDLNKIPVLGQKNTLSENLEESVKWIIEADTFWCVTKLLDTIQDHFTFAQPGIQRQVQALADIIKRVDIDLHNHLSDNQIEYMQFAFRWMNNLLMREIPLRCTIRLWDAYLAESDGFVSLHLFVCSAFLLYWKQILIQQTDFQGLLMLLQSLPTSSWGDDNIELLLAEAYKLKYTYGDSPAHYSRSSSSTMGFGMGD